ncbi:hypothetical protein, partial [Collimonas fungivorans]|uniref:hypothetical protein n=1 Tax=Collimonas fungivorans TaxID=158899 RepID=UPI003FA3DBDE
VRLLLKNPLHSSAEGFCFARTVLRTAPCLRFPRYSNQLPESSGEKKPVSLRDRPSCTWINDLV